MIHCTTCGAAGVDLAVDARRFAVADPICCETADLPDAPMPSRGDRP